MLSKWLLVGSLLLATNVSARTRILNPLDDLVSGDASIDDVSIQDVATDSSRKSSMLEDGYVLLSSEESNGVVFDLWGQTESDSSISDISRRGLDVARRSLDDRGVLKAIRRGNVDVQTSEEERRSDGGLHRRVTIDIQGRHCATACAFQTNVPKANPNDCSGAYNQLYAKVGIFTLPPTQALSATSGTCSVWVVNHSASSITYDYWDAGGTGQWLNYDCLIRQSATVGLCMYNDIGTNVTNGVWTAVCAPSFMTG